MSKLVILKFGEGNFQEGFPVILQIGEDGALPSVEIPGKLPPCPEIQEHYSRWQLAYRSLGQFRRLQAVESQVTNLSLTEIREKAQVLSDRLNHWLNSEQFRPIKEKLLQNLKPSEEIRVIIQSEDIGVRKLPWHLWHFEDYPQAKLALSATKYERTEKSVSVIARNKIRILAILGSSGDIDIQKDREILEKLPDAETIFLVEPQRKELNEFLWDEEGWDILFFAGHSDSQGRSQNGLIYINQTDSLTIDELKYALNEAIKKKLKLAIFNSCDGLGIVSDLEELHIPQVIAMREPVPDRVAQEFLKYFLKAFSSGKSLYASVREAREKLQGLEDEFPCASWLPVIIQNPAETPVTWQELRGNQTRIDNKSINFRLWEHLSKFVFSLKIKRWLVISFYPLLFITSNFFKPNPANFFKERGDISRLARDWKEAQNYYSLALRFKSDDAAVHYKLGVAYENLRDFEKARSEYQKAAQKGYAPGYNNLALLAKVTGNYDEAVDWLKQRLTLATDDRDKYSVQTRLGEVLYKANRYQEAEDYLRKAIALDSNSSIAHCILARVLKAQGKTAEAQVEFDRCYK